MSSKTDDDNESNLLDRLRHFIKKRRQKKITIDNKNEKATCLFFLFFFLSVSVK